MLFLIIQKIILVAVEVIFKLYLAMQDISQLFQMYCTNNIHLYDS